MPKTVAPRYEDLTIGQRRRLAIQLIVRSVVVAILLFAAYYLLPLDRPANAGIVVLVVGMLVLALVLTWQIRAITGSPFPRLRAFEALTIGVPLILIVFAAAYYLIGIGDPHSFSQAMSRTDALYFTVTVFATVGFGDITATSELARILVSIQMMFDLLIFGLVAKLIFGAVEVGLRRRSSTPEHRPDSGPVDA